MSGCTFTFSGTLDASVTQSGGSLKGTFLLSYYQFFKVEGGSCVGVDRPAPAAMTFESGKFNNNGSVSGDLILFGLHPPFKGTLNASTFSGATDGSASNKARISFQLTRISTQVLPLISASYVRDRPTATGSAWLSWASSGATAVFIGGTQPLTLFGHFQFGMPATRTFTLSATAANGLTGTTAVTILTARLPEADVVLSAAPATMMQGIGATGGTTTFTLTNFGGTNSEVSLATDADFFSISPRVFTLTPLASQVVTLTATTQQSGARQGSVAITGSGVVAGSSVPVTLLVAARPLSPGTITTSTPRAEAIAQAGTNPSTSLSFTNNSASTIDGVLSTEAPWIVIQNPRVTLGPGQTTDVAMNIDRSRRTAPAFGGASGEVLLRHLSSDGGSSAVSATVLDIITPNTLRPISSSDIQPGWLYFAPGMSRKPSSFSDASLGSLLTESRGTTLAYLPSGQQNGAALDLVGPLEIPALGSWSFPRTLQYIFPQFAEEGTLMTVAGANSPAFLLPLRHARVHTTAGLTIATALPVFRSDQGYGPGSDLFLTGLQKSSTRSTTLYLQELTVAGASVTVDFFDSAGRRVGSSGAYSLARAGSVQLADAVPSGATSVRIRNNTAATLINGFGLVFDTTTADLLPLVAPVPGSGTLFFPAFVAPAGGEMFLYLGNASEGEITVSATLSELAPESSERRRAAPHSTRIETQAGPFTIPALGSRRLRVTGDGVVRLTGPAALRASAAMTVPGVVSAGRVGTAVPFLPASAAMAPAGGARRRFTGVEDSSPATIAAKRAGTYRSNLMLVETLGHSTFIVVTLHYTFPGGNPNDSADVAGDYILPANGVLTIPDVVRTLLGPLAADYGDIHNATIDVEISGSAAANGTILAFLQTVDNGTGDIAIRLSD